MWPPSGAAAFITQREALVDAEAMLLVGYDQTQAGVFHLLLKQRVGADRKHRLGALQSVKHRGALRFGETPAQQHNFDTQRSEPALQVAGVLLRQQLSRRHQRYLVTAFDQAGRNGCSDGGLTRADVSLQQTQHGIAAAQILIDLSEDS